MAKNFSDRRWADKVYKPDIVSKSEPDWHLRELPKYNALESKREPHYPTSYYE